MLYNPLVSPIMPTSIDVKSHLPDIIGAIHNVIKGISLLMTNFFSDIPLTSLSLTV